MYNAFFFLQRISLVKIVFSLNYYATDLLLNISEERTIGWTFYALDIYQLLDRKLLATEQWGNGKRYKEKVMNSFSNRRNDYKLTSLAPSVECIVLVLCLLKQ